MANIEICMSPYYPDEEGYSDNYVSMQQVVSAIRKDLKDIRSGVAKPDLYTETFVKIGSALTLCYEVGASSREDEDAKEEARRLRKEVETMKRELLGLCTCTCTPKRPDTYEAKEPRVIKKKFGDKLYYAIDRRH